MNEIIKKIQMSSTYGKMLNDTNKRSGIYIHIKYTLPKAYEKSISEVETEFDLTENLEGESIVGSPQSAYDLWTYLIQREEHLIREKYDSVVGLGGRYETIDLRLNNRTIKHWSRKEVFGF